MSRSPLAYPLNRGADMDVGGAADLQTDIMRFMAILSLCLVAIFALVQSLPMTPQEPTVPSAQLSEPKAQTVVTAPAVTKAPKPAPSKPVAVTKPETRPAPPAAKKVQLTRPEWVPEFTPTAKADPVPETRPMAESTPVTAAVEEQVGFTLRFESDAALTRLVAANQIGVYAIAGDRAQRMSVSESRISFWDASMPAQFHEMEVSTVPTTVIDALGRTGSGPKGTQWGVTLPGKLSVQLDSLMQQHQGGALVIGADGAIQREAI